MKMILRVIYLVRGYLRIRSVSERLTGRLAAVSQRMYVKFRRNFLFPRKIYSATSIFEYSAPELKSESELVVENSQNCFQYFELIFHLNITNKYLSLRREIYRSIIRLERFYLFKKLQT